MKRTLLLSFAVWAALAALERASFESTGTNASERKSTLREAFSGLIMNDAQAMMATTAGDFGVGRCCKCNMGVKLCGGDHSCADPVVVCYRYRKCVRHTNARCPRRCEAYEWVYVPSSDVLPGTYPGNVHIDIPENGTQAMCSGLDGKTPPNFPKQPVPGYQSGLCSQGPDGGLHPVSDTDRKDNVEYENCKIEMNCTGNPSY